MFVQQKLQEFPILKPVCLILKKLLVINQLNDPYIGGLGSFSLFLMLYAAYYLERLNSNWQFHSEHTHTARLFSWFLLYFGEYFDMDINCITFMHEYMPFAMPKIW